MTFQEHFLACLLSSTRFTPTLYLDTYLPRAMPVPADSSSLLSLASAGHVTCAYPYHYKLIDFPYNCLIFTIRGNGLYTVDEKSLRLIPGSLLFINCRQCHEIRVEGSQWEFYVVFIEETSADYFYRQFSKRHGAIVSLPVTPHLISLFSQLAEAPGMNDPDTCLVCHRLLTDLLTTAILQAGSMQDDSAPSYIKKMKKILDTQYAAPHSLNEFEELLNISKYRLSREFHKQYGEPPIQYLNKIRIKQAQELLHRPDMTVYEAGRLVGIDNTTHFIHLFRKYLGVTPAVYQKSLRR